MLALYWATNRRFWSCSKPITEGIDPNDHMQDPDVRESVRWCSLDSVRAASEREIRDDLARRHWADIGDLDAAIERAISDIEQPQVRSTLPAESSFRCVINYIGAYAQWDLPANELGDQSQHVEAVEQSAVDTDRLPVTDRESDPPIVDV